MLANNFIQFSTLKSFDQPIFIKIEVLKVPLPPVNVWKIFSKNPSYILNCGEVPINWNKNYIKSLPDLLCRLKYNTETLKISSGHSHESEDPIEHLDF